MKDLIAKLEAATEGSRELDALIETYLWEVAGFDKAKAADMGKHRGKPAYTTSLDAALALVPEADDRDLTISQWGRAHNPGAVWRAQISFTDRLVIGASHTPALALCIAALKARSAS